MFIFPSLRIDNPHGHLITIDCGSLPEVPDWLRQEVDAIIDRLEKEVKETRNSAPITAEASPCTAISAITK